MAVERLSEHPCRDEALSYSLSTVNTPKDEDICPICREIWNSPDTMTSWDEEPDEIVEIRHCHHIFHTKCIRDWLMTDGCDSCPLCRTQVFQYVETYIPIEHPESIVSIGIYESDVRGYLRRTSDVLTDPRGGSRTRHLPQVHPDLPRVIFEEWCDDRKKGCRIRVRDFSSGPYTLMEVHGKTKRRSYWWFSDAYANTALFVFRYKITNDPEDFFTPELFDE